MDQGPRNHVTFVGVGFNTADEKEEFINPGSFAKDVTEWLASELPDRGLWVDDDIGQEDFGWYITFAGTSGTKLSMISSLVYMNMRTRNGWAGPNVLLDCSRGFLAGVKKGLSARIYCCSMRFFTRQTESLT